MKIACWSGPRNLSTAMMYSFAQHPDLSVVDEPFYAAFLYQTGISHPLETEIMASQSSDPKEVVKALPTGSHYLKLMTHHMLPQTPTDWAQDYTHIFLIRHPARVLASYQQKRQEVTLADIGFVQQMELFQTFGGIVIDSADIRNNPAEMMRKLCAAIGLEFSPAMLHWHAGGNPADGIWAKHWYNAVHKSTGFAGAEGPLPDVQSTLLDAALPIYEKLHETRLR